MNLQLPARLIELFGRYRQINSILDENWRDVTSKDFFSNFVDPVNSGWNTFHRQTNEALATIKRLHSENEDGEARLSKAISDLNIQLYHTPLKGELHYHVKSDSESVDILIPERYYYVTQNDDRLLEYVRKYVPDADENTRISLKRML